MEKHVLYFEIELAARKIRKFGQEIMDQNQLGITVEQWLVLKVVHEHQSINQSQIGALLVKDKPTISKMIRSLENKGVIKKMRSNLDSRAFDISLSEKGNEWMTRLMPLIEEIRFKGLKGLKNEELSTTIDVLKRVTENIEN
ncbi:transcriptional regulator, SarA/Rot family [Croceivirga thetidis]|uniref:MarR family transcriptional regulator n=1 Tax=Croceivirga thetidis TaxID=2721623 RepID=A0ABX1GPI4_9FLAO|nr:MarR family transcriptional regulator [Croceivirga thetidis]